MRAVGDGAKFTHLKQPLVDTDDACFHADAEDLYVDEYTANMEVVMMMMMMMTLIGSMVMTIIATNMPRVSAMKEMVTRLYRE